jgi:hypothetical protein
VSEAAAEPDPAAEPQRAPDRAADLVAEAVARVEAELAARRERGELPDFPPHEMRRHFDAVVEAYEGALLELPAVDIDGIRGARVISGIIPNESRVPGGSSMHRVVAKVVSRQVRGLAEQMRSFGNDVALRIEDIADRQDRMRRFLLVAHLDRVRQLEYRVAQLELELERAREQRTTDGTG